MRRIFAATLICLGCALSATPGAADSLPVQGGPGGGNFDLPCPANFYMLGVALRFGAWVDAIRANCLAFDSNAQKFVRPPSFTDFRGGTGGGGPKQDGCQDDHYVSGIEYGFTREGNDPKYLDYVKLICSPIKSGNRTEVCLDTGEGCWFSREGKQDIPVFGGKSVIWAFTQFCPDGQAATGIHGRSGSYVDALGLICGPKPVLVAAPPTPPAPADKPVQKTGTEKTDTAPPPPNPAPPPTPPAQQFVEVLKDVDVYSKSGGKDEDKKKDANGDDLTLFAGTQSVTLLERKAPWYHLQWPGQDGWVYSGSGWVSLKLP